MKSLTPRTSTAATLGRSNGRVPEDEAAAALCGVEPVPYAFLLLAYGEASPGQRALCDRYLRGCAGWEAEDWRDGRLDGLVKLCLAELPGGYASKGKRSDAECAEYLGIKRAQWAAVWKRRYRRIMRDAQEQIGRAHETMARRALERAMDGE